MNLFSRLFRRKPPEDPPAPFTARPAPKRPLYAIGDIHGRDDLLAQMLERISRDADGKPHDLVLVGDYVDRGEASAAVLRRLAALDASDHVVCLKGNHEAMLLEFLDDPEGAGRRWIRNGGLQTLASFGVGGVTETASGDAMKRIRDQLRAAMGDLEAWLRGLRTFFHSGNIMVAHAGADPRLPADEQDEKTLLWGHPAFHAQPRQDGIWVVHGHTVVDAARARDGRISIDTGAYATGRLTAVALERDDIRFLDA